MGISKHKFRKCARTLAMAACALLTSHTPAMETGFNQAWLKNDFAQQWLDDSYDTSEVERMLTLVQNGGSNILRMWLFEGNTNGSIEWSAEGRPVALKPQFIKNLSDFLSRAQSRGVQVYLTLLSSTLKFDGVEATRKAYWYNVLNGKHGFREEFKRVVLSPLLDLILRPEFRGALYGLDLVNEIDAYVMHGMFEDDYHGMNRFVCDLRSEVKTRADLAGSVLPVTASLGWPWIPFRHRGAIHILLDPNPHPNCVDFWDIHLYNNEGEIPRCNEIHELTRSSGKKIILGEFGQQQLTRAYDDHLQTRLTRNFLRNAQACGFSAALAWRLSDERGPANPEARYSYTAYGQTRPAYQEFVRYRASNP